MAQRSRDQIMRRGTSLIAVMLVGLLLASCGPIGNDDDPTPTAESVSQSTESATSPATEDSGETATVEQDSTESADDAASPSAIVDDQATSSADVAPLSTPIPASTQPGASPTAMEPASSGATPVVESVPGDAAFFTGEDGTGGATPPPPSQGTPSSLFVAVDNSPETSIPPGASPPASPAADEGALLTDLTAAIVTGCVPEIIPVITLSDVTYSTISDVNIRSGPGVDCDQLPISPIGEFQLVTLIGGPVIREGDDFIWVQVTAPSGETGWIVTDGITPDE